MTLASHLEANLRRSVHYKSIFFLLQLLKKVRDAIILVLKEKALILKAWVLAEVNPPKEMLAVPFEIDCQLLDSIEDL